MRLHLDPAKWASIALVFLFVTPALSEDDAVEALPEVELEELGKASDFRLPLADGGHLQLFEALKKGPVVLDFWATWCVPCRKALPRYQKLHETYGERGVQILAVSEDDPRSRSKVNAFFRSHRLTFPSLLDGEKQVGRRYRAESLPVTLLIRPDGQIVYRHTGYREGDERLLEAAIVQVLEQSDQ